MTDLTRAAALTGGLLRTLLPILFLVAWGATPAGAQEGADPAKRAVLRPGASATDSLAAGAVHEYTLALSAERWVFAVVEQRSVDVRVTVRDPSGEVVGRFDGRERGEERVHFDGGAAGTYTLAVAPADSGAGWYAVRLDRVEARATEPGARVDQLMAPYSGNVPGGVVAVVRDGAPVFARGYGMANLSHAVPFTPGTRTNIGSTTKQFTAFAIALLAERGRLSLDDEVQRHIPELRTFDHPVTLRHLLTHTSGYREYMNTLVLAGRRVDLGDWVGPEELVDIVDRQPALQNEPGAEWNYNNTAYALLALVVERVTGSPYAEWLAENVFGPLGMDHTVVRTSPFQVIEDAAHGYGPGPDGFLALPDLGGSTGAGGMYTTVGDLAKWLGNLETGALGGPDVIRAMTTPYVLTTGDTTEYGLGLMIDELRGARRIHHGGADLAHRSSFMWFPDAGTGVIVVSNYAAFPGSIATEVASLFLGDALDPEPAPAVADASAGDDADADLAPFDPDAYDPARFDALVGRYSLDEMPTLVLTFFREGDELFTQLTGQSRVPLQPTSDSTFALVGVLASVAFHRDEDGTVSHIVLHQNGEHRATPLEGEKWTPTVADLEAFTGRYFSEELETFYTIALEDDALRVRHRRFDDVPLADGDEADHFTGAFPIGTIEFLRDDDGRVTALLAGNGRARDIRFERVF